MTRPDIDLPDLDSVRAVEIVADNVRAMGPMIVAAMFDALKAFDVADRIVEQFQGRLLLIGSGEAGRMLDRHWRERRGRMTASERRSFYAGALGVPGGDPAAAVNRGFDGLWLRFVTAVADSRSGRSLTRRARLAETASALSALLSKRGAKIHDPARALQADLDSLTKLLRDPEILRAYGARDMWQVIERVAADQLGGAANGARYRALAVSGATIVDWLADRSHRIEREKCWRLDLRKPGDRKLVEACERWLQVAPERRKA